MKNENLIKLLGLAKGENRTFTEYSKAAGISQAAMTRMLKGDYTPSARTMKKLTSKEASPQNGVTYSEMMLAAGYYISEPLLINGHYASSGQIGDMKKFKSDCIQQIYNALIKNSILFKKKDEINIDFNSLDNLLLTLYEQPVKEWIFDFAYIPSDTSARSEMQRCVGKALLNRLDKSTKLTIVTNNSFAYQYAKRFEMSLDIHEQISIVLFDTKKDMNLEECFLSNRFKPDNKIQWLK